MVFVRNIIDGIDDIISFYNILMWEECNIYMRIIFFGRKHCKYIKTNLITFFERYSSPTIFTRETRKMIYKLSGIIPLPWSLAIQSFWEISKYYFL